MKLTDTVILKENEEIFKIIKNTERFIDLTKVYSINIEDDMENVEEKESE